MMDIGKSYWDVMFSRAYQLPDHVTRNQSLKFRQDILNMVKQYPCKDCVVDSVAWMRSNKPDGIARNDYVNYLCNMKNFVNAKLGKDIFDCSLLTTNDMHNSQTSCESCKQADTNPSNEDLALRRANKGVSSCQIS